MLLDLVLLLRLLLLCLIAQLRIHGIRKPKTYTDGTVHYDLFTSIGEPQHHNEALGDTRWKLAMESEMNALKKNEAWHLVSRKPRINVIDCKWVYKIKRKADDNIDRYKA
jgi:hypothetical protein